MTAFSDEYTSQIDGMDPCIVCQSPTRSHVLLVEYEAETNRMVAVDTIGEDTVFGTVCHDCYRDADGDADKVARQYDAREDKVLESMDATKRDIAYPDNEQDP